jgi:predicted ATPase
MRVTHLVSENYRSFYGRHELRLRPLTLLYGYNHSGKSALLRALALLGESASNHSRGPLALESDAGRGAGWDDLKSQALAASEGMGLGLKIENQTELPGQRHSELFFRFDYDINHRQVFTREIHIGVADSTIVADFELREGAGGLRLASSRLVRRDSSGEQVLSLAFPLLDPRTLFPSIRELFEASSWSTSPTPEILAFMAADRVVSALPREFQWLSSVRACPPRRTQLRPTAPARMAPDGNGAVEILARDTLMGSALLRRVQEFYQRLSHPGRFALNLDIRSDDAVLTLTPGANPLIQVNLVDGGEGLAQVLSVLLALAQVERASTQDPKLLLLEQPELHLHPKAEQLLGRTLCDVVARQSEATLVVETHSEVLLLSIFEAILLNKIRSDQVALCWVRQDNLGRSRIDEVTLDYLARPGDDWPPNVFTEAAELANRVSKLRRERAGR